MTRTEIYAEILTTLSALKDTEAAKYWQKSLSKEPRTGRAIRKSLIFPNDPATILYAMKADIEKDMRRKQTRIKGKKNYTGLRNFAKRCYKQYILSKPIFATAHERNGKYFLFTPCLFYISNDPDNLIFTFDEDEYKQDIDHLYDVINNFNTDGASYKIPYPIDQLKAWRKFNGKRKKAFSIGYPLSRANQVAQCYAAINIDHLIMAMEVTGSDILLTDDNTHMAMEDKNGNRMGMTCIISNSQELQKI